MRNLAQYPVTTEECIKYLEEIKDYITNNVELAPGDMRLVIIQDILRRLNEHYNSSIS